jgi:hypothetical protein
MMFENIPLALESIASATSTLKAFNDWRAGTKGDAYALIEELKENTRYCWLVLEKDINPESIIPRLSTAEYDRLGKSGFDFNALKRQPISNMKSLKGTDLASWQGKSTEALIANIYDKIKDIKTLYPYLEEQKNIQWKIRIGNIQKRTLLLLRHVTH